MELNAFNEGLLEFLESSPTPFHATIEMARRLEDVGFERLHEAEPWSIKPKGKYFVTRNQSSIIAFQLGAEPLTTTGIPMVGAHTDSPCLKVKPNPDIRKQGVAQLGVEVYGGALFNPWFDRDLSIAGRVHVKTQKGTLASYLYDFSKPIAFIPSLAIHLDREVNEHRAVNAQKHLPPVLFLANETTTDITFKSLLKDALLEEGLDVVDVLDYEMCLYDTQPPQQIGLKQEFIASARLDNLLSCYVALQALIQATEGPALTTCNDHEEVGSASACGAQGTFLQNVLERLEPNAEARVRLIQKSMMISADNAHAIHPNYSDLHDHHHGPRLNQGPVIKTNANQRYATTSETSARFQLLCQEVDVKVQSFVTRTDLACGSTIGPITASEIGIPTMDVGIPQWGMHSCREICGSEDPYSLYRVLLKHFD